MKRFLILVILVLTLSLTLFGCGKKKEALPTGYPVEFNGVTVEKKPQRVVSLSKSVTEKLVVLGYKSSIVGDGGSFAEPNFPKLEEISALSPEMVISGGELSPDFKGKLADMGIKTLVIPYTEDKEELYRLWGGLARIFEGSITGELRERQLRYFGESYDKYLNEAAIDGIAKKYTVAAPRVLVATYKDFAATPDTLTGAWLNDMGFLNAALNASGWYAPLKDMEAPDILFYPLGQEDLFANLGAEKKIPYDINYLENQSPMMFVCRYDMLAAAFPEEKFKAPDCIMPLPVPSPPPLKWYEKILAKF